MGGIRGHTLKIEIVGAKAKAKKSYMIGIGYLQLEDAKWTTTPSAKS